MAATRPGSATAQQALWKVGGGLVDGGSSVTAVVPDLPALPVLREAIVDGRSVGFAYRGLRRRVDPWGVLLQTGFWYLVGYDHERESRRTYRIDRIEEPDDGPVIELGEVALVGRPADFDPSAAVPDDPKLIGSSGDVSHAQVWIGPSRAASVEREVGLDRVISRADDGSVVVSVPCANLPAFRSWVLGFLTEAEVLGPPEVRADVIGWLEGVG